MNKYSYQELITALNRAVEVFEKHADEKSSQDASLQRRLHKLIAEVTAAQSSFSPPSVLVKRSRSAVLRPRSPA